MQEGSLQLNGHEVVRYDDFGSRGSHAHFCCEGPDLLQCLGSGFDAIVIPVGREDNWRIAERTHETACVLIDIVPRRARADDGDIRVQTGDLACNVVHRAHDEYLVTRDPQQIDQGSALRIVGFMERPRQTRRCIAGPKTIVVALVKERCMEAGNYDARWARL